MLNSSDRYWK